MRLRMRIQSGLILVICTAVSACQGPPLLERLLKRPGKPAAETGESAKDRQKREGAEAAFIAECARLATSGATVKGKGDWLFSAAELKEIGSTPEVGSGTFASTAAAISDYRQQLKKNGVELVVAFFPPKALVFPDEVSKELKVPVRKGVPTRLDGYAQAMGGALEQKGVKVVDLTPDFLKNRTAKGGGIYTPGGSGITPLAAKLAAEHIAAAVDLKKNPGLLVANEMELTGGNDLGGKPEKLAARAVLKAENAGAVPFTEGGSGVVLICDASGTAWRREHASLAEQLCFELQRPIGLLSGTTARNDQRYKIMRLGTTSRNPLAGTKVLVWCFNSLEFGRDDWRKVPLALTFKEADPTIRLN